MYLAAWRSVKAVIFWMRSKSSPPEQYLVRRGYSMMR
jgi:hypothetical protein